MGLTSFQASIDDMQCSDCENAIEEAVLALPGIQKVNASFRHELVTIEFDSTVINSSTICAAIEKAGYHCQPFEQQTSHSLFKRFSLILLALLGIVLLLKLKSWVDIDISNKELVENFNYSLLFLVGVLTSFHCVGMCGGFVISYSAKTANSQTPAYLKHLSYGFGKLLSYSFFGASFGLFGQFISFTPDIKAIVSGLAGVFLILYGLSMQDSFAVLRHLHIRMPRFFMRSLTAKKRTISSPLAIGLMNGLMIACGPLQAMYILAAGTGSPLQGAKMLAVFALGTLPMMLMFGYLATVITANATRKLLKLSSVIVIALGAVMLNRSLLMSGSGYDFKTLSSKITGQVKAYIQTQTMQTKASEKFVQQQLNYQIAYMEVEGLSYHPNKFMIKKGVPVKWIINVTKLSPCNNKILVPNLEISQGLHQGLQVLSFTPQEEGIIQWTCGMGMMSGHFTVKE